MQIDWRDMFILNIEKGCCFWQFSEIGFQILIILYNKLELVNSFLSMHLF